MNSNGNRAFSRTHPPILCDWNPVNFTRDPTSTVSIRKFERGAITIGSEVITENVVIFRDQVMRDMALPEVASIGEKDLDLLLAENPEIVILGTGWSAERPARDLVFAMARRGVGFEVMDTPAACRTFNILIGEGRDAAAIIVVQDS